MPEFNCTRDVALAATPEQVWDAVATAAGNAAWLFPNEIDSGAPTTVAWNPPHRFATRHERGEWFNALEFVIEGRGGGTTRLRYMHSGIFTGDWENQFDAIGQHTDFYLHTLGQYLRHFQGRTATYVGDVPGGIQGPPGSAGADGFARLQRALGIGAAGVDDRVRLATPPGLEPVEGVVDYRRANFVGVRTPDELYCLFGRNAFAQPVAISIHSFLPGVDAADACSRWERWLAAELG
jgi:hypothetical protein